MDKQGSSESKFTFLLKRLLVLDSFQSAEVFFTALLPRRDTDEKIFQQGDSLRGVCNAVLVEAYVGCWFC